MKTKSCGNPGPKTKIRLKKPGDAIRLLNRVVNSLMDGTMPTDTGRAVIYACSVVVKVFEISDLEERVQKLEGKGGR